MKKNFKISLSIVLAITMIFSSAYVGLGELDFKSAVVAGASQVSDGDLTFTLNDNGTEYYVTGSTSAVEGDLVIPDTYNALPVTLIEQNVFRDNTAITSVTMGGNINEIREHAFTGCDNLAAVYVKDLTAWCAIDFIYPESNPLYWAGNLYLNGELVTDLVIPEEVTHINPRVFYNCTSLTSVTVHDGLKSIGEYAFAGCKLEKVNVTDLTAWCGIEFDGYNANPLYYAPWLCLNGEVMSELVIPEGTEVISDYAFYNCENIADVTIPDSVTRVGYNALKNTGFYNNEVNWTGGVLYADNHLIKAETALEGDYVIKDGTVTVSDKAFYNCKKLTAITIPESVATVGYSAWEKCTILEKMFWNAINVADFTTVSKILYGAGTAADGIEVVFGDKVESIPEYLFYVNDYDSVKIIKKVTFGKSVERIGNAAFWNCDGLTEIVIPDSVKSIGMHTFANCGSVTTITLGKGVTHITEKAFENCTRLEKIYWNAKNVADFESTKTAFNNIGNDSEGVEFIFGSEVEYIPANALCLSNFIFRFNITGITILDSNPVIGENAFGDCVNLTSVKTRCNYNARECFDDSVLELTHGEVSDWIVDEEATCVDGAKHKECTLCGDVFETAVIIGSGEHTPSEWIFDEVPTCTAGGSKHKECTECGEVLEVVTYSATGHTTGHWIVDVQPTVNAPGEQHKECIDCGKVVETEAIPQLKPATPKVETTNEIGGINVTWNAVDGAVRYNVYRRQGGYSTWTLVGTATGTALLDKNVKSGIYYVYSVRAYNNAGQYSDFISASTQTRKFMAVPKLTGISNDTNGLYVKWNPVNGVTEGYRVYRRGAGSTYWTYLGTTTNTYYIDAAVKNRSGEYFRYTVIANGGYHSKFDTTGLYLKRLANPVLKGATSTSAGITVKWGAVNGTTGYYVYRKTAGTTWVRVAAVGGTNKTSYVDKSAVKGTTYTYTVRAVYGSTTSSYNAGISCKDKY